MSAKPSRLVASIAKATATAFAALRADHVHERFYFFALYTTDSGSYVCATAWSEEALAQVVRDYAVKTPKKSAAELARDLRFSAPDSPYHEAGAEHFAGMDGKRGVHEACFEALALLDRDGFFGKGELREGVILNVVYGDMSDERWLAHAVRLNPPEALEAARPFLRLHVPSGRVSCWGQKAYQVNSLSLSADRSMLAYSGSGGEVGVMRVGTREPVYERRRRGEHWASVLSPDGGRLYLGDDTGVGFLRPKTGKLEPLVRTWKPSCLALSPDGSKLVVSCFDFPLSAYDAASGEWVWEAQRFRKVEAAFSPCGKWLAVAEANHHERVCRVTCLDALTGRELWSAPLGDGTTESIAWTPDGSIIGASGNALSLPLLSPESGRAAAVIQWRGAVDAIATSSSGARIALCCGEAIVVIDRSGRELGRGNGGHESLLACCFTDEDTVVAVGRDVNHGPALLTLSVG